MFDLKKEIEEFDQMLSEMSGDEVMQMLIDNGYGKIETPLDVDYNVISSKSIYSSGSYNDLKISNSKLNSYNEDNEIYLGAA